MAKKSVRSITPIPVDPTIETTDVVIGDKVYRMCFDLRSLAIAEEKLVGEGHNVNLLVALPRMDKIVNIRILFAASIQRFHPEIDFEDGLNLLNISNIYKVANAIASAVEKSMSVPDKDVKANPIEPGQ